MGRTTKYVNEKQIHEKADRGELSPELMLKWARTGLMKLMKMPASPRFSCAI